MSTLFTASPEPSRLWIRVLKRVHPGLPVAEQDTQQLERLDQRATLAYAERNEVLLRAVLASKGSPPDPWKAWAQAQQATPTHSTDRSPTGPEAFAILWAACAVLCLLLYEILAALREIVGPVTCLSFLVLLTAAALWVITKNSKLSYNHKATSVWAVASAMILIGTCLLSTSRATPLFLSAHAATAKAIAAPAAVRDSGPLDLVKAPPPQTTEAAVTPARQPRGVSPGLQLAGYIDAVKNSVGQKWNSFEVAASTPAGATVYIQFAVRRRGDHQVPTVETSSGYSSLDASCLRAVNQIPAFGHFPKSYTGESLTVLYHCTYSGSPGEKFAQDSTLPPAPPHVPGEVAPAAPATDSVVIK